MKKLVIMGALSLAGACTQGPIWQDEQPVYMEPEVSDYVAPQQLGTNQDELNDEQTLRVTNSVEAISAVNNEIPLLKDNQDIIVEEIIPDEEFITPEVYSIAATRVTNKMLDDTANIYEKNKPTIYINQITKEADDLPDGFWAAKEVTTKILEGSRYYNVVNNKNDAQYSLDIKVSKIPVENMDIPAVVYKMTLLDKDNKELNTWQQILRKVQNDNNSWW